MIEEITEEMRHRYGILGVAPGSSLPDIREAYKILAKKYHPDKSSANRAESLVQFQKIKDSYEQLTRALRKQEQAGEQSQSLQSEDESFNGLLGQGDSLLGRLTMSQATDLAKIIFESESSSSCEGSSSEQSDFTCMHLLETAVRLNRLEEKSRKCMEISGVVGTKPEKHRNNHQGKITYKALADMLKQRSSSQESEVEESRKFQKSRRKNARLLAKGVANSSKKIPSQKDIYRVVKSRGKVFTIKNHPRQQSKSIVVE